MVVLRMEIHLRLQAAGSLKEKRLVLRSVKDRLKNRWKLRQWASLYGHLVNWTLICH